METKAEVALDEMELEIVYQALTSVSDDFKFSGNQFRARLNDSVARKILTEKIRLQDRQTFAIQQKYGK